MSQIASNLTLLNGENYLMIYMRSMEILNFVVCFLTLWIIHVHSAKSLGAYKYCLYQIVLMSLISQQLTLLGPVFLMPIIGGYQTVDVFTSFGVHCVLCTWMLLSAFDIMSILDGFNYRCRVLIQTFYPQFTNRSVWIGFSILVKIIGVVLIGGWLLPIGMQLNRDTMRVFLEKDYPNVLPTFDAHQSFIVYNVKDITGFYDAAIALAVGVFLLCGEGFLSISAIVLMMWIHRDQMSAATRKIHTRFVFQLGMQAAVPLVVLVGPLFSLLLLILTEFPFQSNWPGYLTLSMLMLHGPLTSMMTIILYDPYRKAVRSYFRGPTVLRSIGGTFSVDSTTSNSVSAHRTTKSLNSIRTSSL